MKNKKSAKNYWESEDGEVVEFGTKFMRCFDNAGKLQFGFKTKAGKYVVQFVLDQQELFGSSEGVSYLRGTLDDWEERFEGRDEANES